MPLYSKNDWVSVSGYGQNKKDSTLYDVELARDIKNNEKQFCKCLGNGEAGKQEKDLI